MVLRKTNILWIWGGEFCKCLLSSLGPDLYSGLDQVDLIDIYRTLHPKSTEYTFFSAPHGTYFKIHHIIGSKTLLSKCKRMEIITSSLSDHSGIVLWLGEICAIDTRNLRRPQKSKVEPHSDRQCQTMS